MIRTSINFVLGVAGSGKTHGFIRAARENLLRSPEGARLLFLTPKQATFQIESEILSARLQGFTRLHIFSFPRLAEFILRELDFNSPRILSEEGRVMIIRSLLDRHAHQLKPFQNAANRPSFADELAALLADFQRHKITEIDLQSMSERPEMSRALSSKLKDLALLSQKYREWLERTELKDSEFLLSLAAECLQNRSPEVFFDELWLDGFSEITPQELTFLLSILRHTRRANLAFCLESDSNEFNDSRSWLDLWATTSELYQRCKTQIASLENADLRVIQLRRNSSMSRFRSPVLRHLEAAWNVPFSADRVSANQDIEIIRCISREDEVLFAARNIICFVREKKARYRDITLIVRNLEDYAAPLRRIFHRYQIPHFIDSRLPIGHHPALILTRSALRLLAFQWQSEDLLSALKTGLISSENITICEFENAVIKHGWSGDQLLNPVSDASLEDFRKKIIHPFEEFSANLLINSDPKTHLISGQTLSSAIHNFWEDCCLEESLKDWTEEAEMIADSYSALLHSGIWDQLQKWLDNVKMAFADSTRTLPEWISVLENGLTRLSVGVIPPTADQVLIGGIGRTRSPNVKLALVLGLNEGIFPESIPTPLLISESERASLGEKFPIPSRKRRIAMERFYGYIACTRASERLILSFAERDFKGKNLVPSSLIGHLRHLFPDLIERRFSSDFHIEDAQHRSELIAPFFKAVASTNEFPAWSKLLSSLSDFSLNELQKGICKDQIDLHEGLSKLLYLDDSRILKSSVSRLEQFAACPFRFFIHSGLRADERDHFQIDQRRMGSFQHLILESFHKQITAERRKWRELSPAEAREKIEKIARKEAAQFDRGIFISSPEAAFSLEAIIDRLGEFASIIIDWMCQYEFDPIAAELGFGMKDGEVGPWKVSLKFGTLEFRGKIDRLDIHSRSKEAAEAVIIDYKSGGKRIDPLLIHNGIQLQLLTYLNVVSQIPQIATLIGQRRLIPSGVFFVPLKGGISKQSNRNKARQNHTHRPRSFQHIGCFDIASLRLLDNRSDQLIGDQIQYRLKKDGSPIKTAWHVMTSEGFQKTMQQTENSIRKMGDRILEGDVSIDPYLHGSSTACLYCPFSSVCRIDHASHNFRILKDQKLQNDQNLLKDQNHENDQTLQNDL